MYDVIWIGFIQHLLLQSHSSEVKVHVETVPVAGVVDLQQPLLAQAEMPRWTSVVRRLVYL